jgi:hypothetical protein
VESTAVEFLKKCSSDAYVLVSQPNVNARDYESQKAVPHLRRAMGSKDVVTRFNVADVVGEIKADGLQDYLENQCGALVTKAEDYSKSSGFIS